MNPFKKTLTEQVIYTPFDLSDATPAGRRRFWKQVLPFTTINYKGHKIKFDKKFHMDLADAFRKEAFDQVPVVFADDDNRHNMNPRNFGGDVLDMQVRPTGTYALIEADEEAAKAIEKNPKLGVSARIRQMVEKSDGRKFPRAVEHICLTMNPRVTGMEPWQAVDLSDEDADIEVVDLTAENYQEGNDMGVRTAKKASSKQPQDRRRKGEKTTSRRIDLSALSDEQFEQMLDLAETLTADPEEDEDLDEEDLDEDEVEDEAPRKTRRKKSKTKVTVEKDEETDDPDDDEEDEEDDNTDLSDSDRVMRDNERSQFQQMRFDLAEERWDNDRSDYLRAGVPAFLLDLAEPVLSLPDAMTIDLSDDEVLDASETIRKMLDGVKGIIDLTGEVGHQMDLSEDEETRDDADKFLDEWDKQYG